VSYVLFVRSPADLERACREVSEYFAFQGKVSRSVPHKVHGAWIEPNTLSRIPLTLVPAVWSAGAHGLAIRERFGVSGIWELARLDVPPEVSGPPALPDAIIDSLRVLAGAEAGLFAPVFNGRLSRPAMDRELSRLRRRYPDVLASPLLQDPHDGTLDCLVLNL